MVPTASPITAAWISDFPIEWDAGYSRVPPLASPEHPATWEWCFLAEFERNPLLRLHILILRKNIPSSFSFQRNGVTFHILKYRGRNARRHAALGGYLLIRRALRQIQPDLVHAWGNERGAALVATRLKYPFLITVQGL